MLSLFLSPQVADRFFLFGYSVRSGVYLVQIDSPVLGMQHGNTEDCAGTSQPIAY